MTKKLFAAYSAGVALIALSVIHRTVEPGKSGNRLAGVPPQPPKILEITPGTLFTPKDETEYNEVMIANAARFPDERDNLKKIDRLEEFFPEDDNGDLEAERQRARDKINAAAAARTAAKASNDAEARRVAEQTAADEAKAAKEAEDARLAAEAADRKKAEDDAVAAQKKVSDDAAAEAQRVADEEAALKVAADKKAAAAAAQKNGNKKPAKAADQDEDESVV